MRSFTVSAIWDDEAQVYICESDIVGLHLEAATIDEFIEEMRRLAPEMIMENHVSLSGADLTRTSLADLIPSIIFNAPVQKPVVAA